MFGIEVDSMFILNFLTLTIFNISENDPRGQNYKPISLSNDKNGIISAQFIRFNGKQIFYLKIYL